MHGAAAEDNLAQSRAWLRKSNSFFGFFSPCQQSSACTTFLKQFPDLSYIGHYSRQVEFKGQNTINSKEFRFQLLSEMGAPQLRKLIETWETGKCRPLGFWLHWRACEARPGRCTPRADDAHLLLQAPSP